MQPQPTGRLVQKDDGVYVVLDRIFTAPIIDIWQYLTRSPRLQTWIGEVSGGASTGAVRFRRNTVEESPWTNVAILECEAPRRFAADIGPSDEAWRIYWHLSEASSHTTLTFGQRLHAPKEEALAGVTWDYYLNRLAAAHAGAPMPVWGDYFPSFLPHYERLAREFEYVSSLAPGA